jgi:hypothetical protein
VVPAAGPSKRVYRKLECAVAPLRNDGRKGDFRLVEEWTPAFGLDAGDDDC